MSPRLEEEATPADGMKAGFRPFVGQSAHPVRNPSHTQDIHFKRGYIQTMKYEHGFTLIELLITILVASLLMALAVPAFNSFIENNRIASSTNELVSALAVARSEAIHRRETASLCSSTDLASCAGSANWETGWILFSDRNGNGAIDGTDVLLRVWEAIPTGHTLTATGGMTRVSFDRLGVASGGDTFRLNNPDCRTGQANRERTITLLTSGSVNVARANCP